VGLSFCQWRCRGDRAVKANRRVCRPRDVQYWGPEDSRWRFAPQGFKSLPRRQMSCLAFKFSVSTFTDTCKLFYGKINLKIVSMCSSLNLDECAIFDMDDEKVYFVHRVS